MEIASIKKELFLIIFLLKSGGFGQTNMKMSREDIRIKIDNKGPLLLHGAVRYRYFFTFFIVFIDQLSSKTFKYFFFIF